MHMMGDQEVSYIRCPDFLPDEFADDAQVEAREWGKSIVDGIQKSVECDIGGLPFWLRQLSSFRSVKYYLTMSQKISVTKSLMEVAFMDDLDFGLIASCHIHLSYILSCVTICFCFYLLMK